MVLGPLRVVRFNIINLTLCYLKVLLFKRLAYFYGAADVLISGLLLSVEASAEAVLVAGCGLHHAGAHLRLHLSV